MKVYTYAIRNTAKKAAHQDWLSKECNVCLHWQTRHVTEIIQVKKANFSHSVWTVGISLVFVRDPSLESTSHVRTSCWLSFINSFQFYTGKYAYSPYRKEETTDFSIRSAGYWNCRWLPKLFLKCSCCNCYRVKYHFKKRYFCQLTHMHNCTFVCTQCMS